MPLNITVPHRNDSDSERDDYEIVGSPSSRPSSWETNVEEYYGDNYFAPRRTRSAAESAAKLEREEAELKERIRELRMNSPGASIPRPPMERASYGSRPRAHDDHMRSPDPESFEAHGHRIHPIPPPPPPPGLRSTPGLPHRSDHRSDLGRPPPTTLRRPSYERRGSENLDDDGWFGPPSPGIEEFSGNARGTTHGVHVHSTSGRRAIVEYVPPGRVSPQYSPVPVEIETGRRRYHPNRIPRDGEHILALQHGIDSSRIDHTPPHTRLPISNRIKPANPYAKENSPNQRSDIHADYRGSSPHRQSEPYYSEHSHIHDGPRPELGRSGPTSPRHDKSPEGGRIHSQVRYLGANSAFIGDISRAPTEPYGYLDSHPASPPRRTEPLYSTSPSYRAPAPAPLPSPIKLRDPAGRVYSFPFNQCKKWGDFQELVKGACGYLEDIGPAVRAGAYDILDPRGGEVRQEEWKEMVRPGWSLTMVISEYGF